MGFSSQVAHLCHGVLQTPVPGLQRAADSHHAVRARADHARGASSRCCSKKEKVFGCPRRCKVAHPFMWGCSYKGVKVAQLLDQLRIFLTCHGVRDRDLVRMGGRDLACGADHLVSAGPACEGGAHRVYTYPWPFCLGCLEGDSRGGSYKAAKGFNSAEP
jgi:hypothetical protein